MGHCPRPKEPQLRDDTGLAFCDGPDHSSDSGLEDLIG